MTDLFGNPRAVAAFADFMRPATDPDFVPFQVGLAAFGGQAMTSTLMDEIRTKRGLAYGAYMTLSEHRGAGAITGQTIAVAGGEI